MPCGNVGSQQVLWTRVTGGDARESRDDLPVSLHSGQGRVEAGTGQTATHRTQTAQAHKKTNERRGRVQNIVPISARPAAAEDLAVPGSWDGDARAHYAARCSPLC